MKMTRDILELAKSDLNGYSDAQFALIGIKRPIPKAWKKLVVAREFPDADVALFIALKNAHLTPAKIKYAETRKAKRTKKREAEAKRQEALAAAGLPQL